MTGPHYILINGKLYVERAAGGLVEAFHVTKVPPLVTLGAAREWLAANGLNASVRWGLTGQLGGLP